VRLGPHEGVRFEEIGSLVNKLKRRRSPGDMVATCREIMAHAESVSVEGDHFG
jgi:hypothetical protein